MHEEVDWDLLGKHLAGECTDEETAQLDAWRSTSHDRERLLAELAEIWTSARRKPAKHDVDALWARLQEHVRGPEYDHETVPLREGSDVASLAQPLTPPHRSPLRGQAADRFPIPQGEAPSRRRIHAATLIVALVACTILLLVWMRESARISAAGEYKTFITERGQRATIRLSDGTIIHLNAASSLAVSPKFGDETRSVRLEGEAFFDVTSDSNRSFLVHAGAAIAQVIGTSFNVTAYPDEDRVRVVVAEGAVALQEAGPNAGSAPVQTVLTAQQMGELDGTGEIVRSGTHVERHLDWMGGFLNFRDAAFPEVALRIARWYDVDVVIDDADVPVGHLNARFAEHQALHDVLHVISTAFDLSFALTNDEVRFFRLESSSDESVPRTRR